MYQLGSLDINNKNKDEDENLMTIDESMNDDDE